MSKFFLGAAKALVAGIITSGAALAVSLGADPVVVTAIAAVLGPLAVYFTRNTA